MCLSYWVIWLFGGNLKWGPLLGNYLSPSYWAIWLFGKNLMLGPRFGSCVSKLLGYLVIWWKTISLQVVGVLRTVGECVPHCSRSTHRAGHFLLNLIIIDC